jgi:hypothetical protein
MLVFMELNAKVLCQQVVPVAQEDVRMEMGFAAL